MALKDKLRFDETKFKPGQKEAAERKVEQDFNSDLTNQQIADEVGITRRTLYRWEYFDDNFIAYRNYIASDFMNSHLGFVYKKLLEGIGDGSQRAIETFLKRIGDMDNNTDVTVHQGENKGGESFEERKQALLSRIENLEPSDVEGEVEREAEREAAENRQDNE